MSGILSKNFYRVAKILKQIRRLLSGLGVNVLISYIQNQRESILKNERYQNEKNLNRFEYQVYSQNGEDGIIDEIFNRIGTTSKLFLEIGVGDGMETLTTFLLLQGWSGYWIDGDKKALRSVSKQFNTEIQSGRLSINNAFITAEKVNDLLSDLAFPQEIDFLSVDIDRNTYWILEPILSIIKPRAIGVEYNALFPPHVDWKVEYAPTKIWDGTTYQGASLKAYETLCSKFGYALVGCEITGTNAFFVRQELCEDKFLEPFTAENHYEPSRDYLIQRIGNLRSFRD